MGLGHPSGYPPQNYRYHQKPKRDAVQHCGKPQAFQRLTGDFRADKKQRYDQQRRGDVTNKHGRGD